MVAAGRLLGDIDRELVSLLLLLLLPLLLFLVITPQSVPEIWTTRDWVAVDDSVSLSCNKEQIVSKRQQT